MRLVQPLHLALLPFLAIGGTIDGAAAFGADSPQVSLLRTPDGGIQPQAVVDATGRLHLIYFKGDPAAGDLFYVCRDPESSEFSTPLQVNSHPGSAVAMGTIRGGQIAVGKEGRVHVVWNGSAKAQPRVSGVKHDTPMLYTRLNDAGTAFEPQRNVIDHAHGLDGGGSVAADARGNVYVAWHANPAGDGEANRRVYLAVSRDEGQTFAAEKPISALGTGACACCGLKTFVDSENRILVQYRAAREQFYRDMYLLVSEDQGRSFQSHMIDEWQVGQCPMSSAAFAAGPEGVFAAWETAGRVLLGRIKSDAANTIERFAAPDSEQPQKHPAVATNGQGDTLFVWTEGTAWKRGGSVAWQMYDRHGTATSMHSSRDGVPAWSLATAVASPDGSFTIVY